MAKIVDVESICLCLSYKELYGSGEAIPEHVLWPIPHAQIHPRAGAYATLVCITDDQGRVGIGEALAMSAPEVTAEIIEQLLKPVLVGANPLDTEVLWQRLYHSMRANGHSRGFMMEAISGADIALWDLAGKTLDLPVYQLLGGAFRKQIKTYASPVPVMANPSDAVRMAESFVKDGFSALKIKIGQPDLARDVSLVREVRATVGDAVELMLDANGAYDLFTALTIGRRLEPYNIYWLEEPFPPEDVDAYVALKRNLNVPLAAGECEATAYNYRDLIGRRAVDTVQPNVARMGGLTAARRLAALADAHNIPLAPHGVGSAVFLAASLHLSAAIPNFLIAEYNRRPNALRDALTAQPFEFDEGFLQVPGGPGLGISLNPDFLQRYRRDAPRPGRRSHNSERGSGAV